MQSLHRQVSSRLVELELVQFKADWFEALSEEDNRQLCVYQAAVISKESTRDEIRALVEDEAHKRQDLRDILSGVRRRHHHESSLSRSSQEIFRYDVDQVVHEYLRLFITLCVNELWLFDLH